MEKLPFFRAAMAGFGKYRTGGYSRIGVYRVKSGRCFLSSSICRDFIFSYGLE